MFIFYLTLQGINLVMADVVGQGPWEQRTATTGNEGSRAGPGRSLTLQCSSSREHGDWSCAPGISCAESKGMSLGTLESISPWIQAVPRRGIFLRDIALFGLRH